MTLGLRRSKYNAKPEWVDNIRFDSGNEAKRYQELKILLKVGIISDLKWHVPYKLDVNGIHITTYEADFTYKDQKGNFVVEDTKGVETREFKIKSKLMLACHNIRIILT